MQKWIKCEDELPAIGTPVLLNGPHWMGYGYRALFYDDWGWQLHYVHTKFDGEITHWGLMPDPPLEFTDSTQEGKKE